MLLSFFLKGFSKKISKFPPLFEIFIFLSSLRTLSHCVQCTCMWFVLFFIVFLFSHFTVFPVANYKLHVHIQVFLSEISVDFQNFYMMYCTTVLPLGRKKNLNWNVKLLLLSSPFQSKVATEKIEKGCLAACSLKVSGVERVAHQERQEDSSTQLPWANRRDTASADDSSLFRWRIEIKLRCLLKYHRIFPHDALIPAYAPSPYYQNRSERNAFATC